MPFEYQLWLGAATGLYVMAFVVWTRLAHAIRNTGSVGSAICFMPMIFATGMESVACGWLAFSSDATMVAVEKFGAATSPFMALGALTVGVWGILQVRCQDDVCSRTKTRLFFHELMKSVPD